MKNTTIKYTLAAAFVFMSAIGLLTAPVSRAEAFGFGLRVGDDTFISKLAGKLGIDVDKIKTAFDDLFKEHQTEMQSKADERLSQAVTEGKITEAQKKLILEKQKELQEKRESNRETFQNMSEEERRTAMEKERTDLETWAKNNGIDLSYMMGFRRGFGKGFKIGRMHSENNSNTVR